MNNCKILGALAAALLIAAMSSVAVGQDKATPQEVVAQLMEAASTLSKTGDLTQSNQEPSLRVWKDTYIFALDCDTMTNAAHPLRPDIRDSEMSSIKDPKGNSIFPNPKGLCEAARKPAGTWAEYWWAKPGEKQGSRKVNYLLGAKGTADAARSGSCQIRYTS